MSQLQNIDAASAWLNARAKDLKGVEDRLVGEIQNATAQLQDLRSERVTIESFFTPPAPPAAPEVPAVAPPAA